MTAIFRHIVITFIFLIIIIDMVGLEDAIEIISTLENAGIKVFIDGGWVLMRCLVINLGLTTTLIYL